MSKTISSALTLDELMETTIRDLVANYPDTMGVLAPYGIDLCCGGAHKLGEALDLHGVARDEVLPEIARVVAARPGR
jgi:iron-sulfur cluster repair protein YtfE (RIC family)